MAIPSGQRVLYNQSIPGVYGVFGAGGGLQAFYIQATIQPSDLNNISLISEIPGSEKWRIQDLFQRDVDNERITEGLLPYLIEQDHIKFFNPLTLTVLPMDEDGYTTLKQMPRILENEYDENELHWTSLEREGFFRVSWIDDEDAYARLEWNDKKARLVAIDGQHRLSALKRFQVNEATEGHRDFLKWRIPIVVVSFRAIQSAEPPSVLDVVRNIFVYINSEAHKVNEARKILLSDQSINNICTQELIQAAHSNDSEEETNPDAIPLLFYDWRGEEINTQAVESQVSVKSVKEINNWFDYYILGEDFESDQKNALKVVPTNKLNAAFVDKKLNYDHVRLARKQFESVLLPALSHLLENFTPYKNYVAQLRSLERDQVQTGDIGTHALSQLRFGSNIAPDGIRPDVDKRISEIEQNVLKIKSEQIGALLLDEIGLRGVISAFGYIYEQMEPPKDWLNYSVWFTEALNKAFSEGWFDDTKKRTKDNLYQVAKDHNGLRINYRLEHAYSSLGAYVELLILSYGDLDEWEKVDWEQIRDAAISRLRSTLVRGYKKEVRVVYKDLDEYRDGGKKLTDAVKVEAEKRMKSHVRRFENQLKKIRNGN